MIIQTNRPTLADRSIKKSQNSAFAVQNIDSTPQKDATVRRIFSAVPDTAVRLSRPRRDPLFLQQRPAKAYTANTLVTRDLYSYFKLQETVCCPALPPLYQSVWDLSIYLKKNLGLRANCVRPCGLRRAFFVGEGSPLPPFF